MRPDIAGGIGLFFTFLAWLSVAPFLLLALAVPYVVLKLRDARAEQPDPQLGFKVAMHYFFSIGVLLILVGITICLVDLLHYLDAGPNRMGARSEFFNGTQRGGVVLMSTGAIVTFLHFLFLLLASSRGPGPNVRRTFLGWRFALCGLMMVLSVAGLLFVFVQRDRDFGDLNELRRTFIGLALVWVPAWLIHFVLLRLASEPPRPRKPHYEWEEDDDPERRPAP